MARATSTSPDGGSTGGRSRRARVARTAALGGGGLTLLGATGVGLLVAEASLAKRWIVPRMLVAPHADGRYGPAGLQRSGAGPVDRSGDPLVLAVLGDSAAAGVGADDAGSTPGALLATQLAELSQRPVELRCHVRPGAVSAELAGQVERLLTDVARPDCTLVIVGGNDVTHRVPTATAVGSLTAAVHALREAGSEVVVGTVPDMGTVTGVHQPLRSLGRRWSRRLAEAQTVGVLEAGGRTVSLGDLLGPDFYAEPELMFSADRFHPSSAGYRRTVAFLLPAVAHALGLASETTDLPPGATEVSGLLEAVSAAAAAVQVAGTELVTADGPGAPRVGWVRRLPRPRGVPRLRRTPVTDE